MPREPKHRCPTPPGEILVEEFLKPLDISQSEFAKRIGVTYARLNEIVNGKRGVTADTALRFSVALGTSPNVWLDLQQGVDLYNARHSPTIEKIGEIVPLSGPVVKQGADLYNARRETTKSR